jgi:starch-binding outer membrane protein, SusD/RagB family
MNCYIKISNMKRNILSYPCLVLLLIAVIFTSCDESFLEQKKLTIDTENVVFADSAKTCNFVNGIYTNLNASWDLGFTMYAATDESECQDNMNLFSKKLTNSSVSPSNVDKTFWVAAYKNIRYVNIFLKNRNLMKISDNLKNRLTGEVHFLRAWYYFMIFQYHGGLPIVGNSIYDDADPINVPRSTFEATLNYILADCDSAALMLPVDYRITDQSQLGRVTKGACMALKSRALLYAASPLYNGGSVATDGNIIALTAYPSADGERWKAAADAAEAVIDLKNENNLQAYKLNVTSGSTKGYGFYDLFTNRWKDEYILAYMRKNNKYVENQFDMPSRGGVPKSFPYQEMVDAFGMQNGLPITDAASGYSSVNPYINRDPRFYYTIIYNGALRYRSGYSTAQPVWTYTGIYDANHVTQGVNMDGLYVSGSTLTGYYCRKMINDQTVTAGGGETPRCEPLIRYAEILLNAAEASNEYYGPSDKIYGWLKDIRSRAGITVGTDGMYGLKKNMTQVEMRDVIRNERQVELAFENHRYFDVRRWKIANVTNNRFMHGVEITRTAQGVFTSKSIEVRKFVFLDQLYLWPILQSEITKSPVLKQNPGY